MKAIIQGYSRPKKKNAEYEVENLFIIIDMPFIPTKGSVIKVTADGEYLTVDEVLWNIQKPNEIMVFTEEPDQLNQIRPYKEMSDQGWRIGSGE